MFRAACLTTITLLACSSNKREDSAPMPSSKSDGAVAPAATAKVYLATPTGEASVNVEVVATEPKIEKGLMYRQHLPPDGGMLFLMRAEHTWSFWMRNTLIPLDMIFIAKDMTIAGIVENAQPLSETLRKVDKPSLYVLEVNGGWAKSAGVVPGAQVRFENVPPR